MSRRTWILMLAALAVVAMVAWAWIDGGLRQREWIEQPIETPKVGL